MTAFVNDLGRDEAVGGKDGAANVLSHTRLKFVSFELVRPADVLPYTAKDVIANATAGAALTTLAGCARVLGGTGRIVTARLATDQGSFVGRVQLNVFHTAPAAQNDNVTYVESYADAPKQVGKVLLPAATTEGAGSAAVSMAKDLNLPFDCDATSMDLYAILEAVDAFTPTSGQKFFVEIGIEQN